MFRVMPPSITRFSPVIKSLSGWERNKHAQAMSTGAVKTAPQIGVQDVVPFVDAHFKHGNKPGYAGIVDEDVNRSGLSFFI